MVVLQMFAGRTPLLAGHGPLAGGPNHPQRLPYAETQLVCPLGCEPSRSAPAGGAIRRRKRGDPQMKLFT